MATTTRPGGAPRKVKTASPKTLPARPGKPDRTQDKSSRPGKPHQPAPAVAPIAKQALVRQAQARLHRIEEIRDASTLAAKGLGQREIAEILRTTQPRVHRMLKATQGRPLDKPSPEELILRATVTKTSRADLLAALKQMDYTFRKHAPAPFDGAVSGTWDQVQAAAVEGLLTSEEYEEIRGVVQPPS